MMNDARLVKISKHLRHEPERLGLALQPGGWGEVDDLLAACARQRLPISRTELKEVVARNDKQRFSFDTPGLCIRANQGHSTAVDLQRAPAGPPDIPYHGTGHGTVDAITRDGLDKMARHRVHLSGDPATAVGHRHGRPVVFAVEAAAMRRDGFVFYRPDNGVWLVDHVPPRYLNQARLSEKRHQTSRLLLFDGANRQHDAGYDLLQAERYTCAESQKHDERLLPCPAQAAMNGCAGKEQHQTQAAQQQ